jgi:type VI secretion system secreted protein VgrG
MPYTQANRRIAITTPLGKDALLLRGFTGTEAISQLFHFDLDLLSENDSVKFQDLVGKNVTLRIFDADGAERYWNGFISRFSQGSQDRRLTAYRAQMVPWLWFLTRTADCRIFQNKTVPDIIQKIFSDLQFQDFELRLYGNFSPRDYCVQYRETDFNFVSRLMEEEGIYYYFKHQEGKHTLVLANDPAAHEPCPGQKTARYDFRGGSVTYEDVITEWHYEEEFRTGTWAQTDYNFETPSTSLAVTVNGKNPYEIYEYPGEYRVRSEGDRLARIRLEEQSAPCAVSQGSSGCRHFNTGFQFTLEDHYRKDLNAPYLITAVRHVATQTDYQAGGSGEELTYRNSFECIPSTTRFRPPRVTPQPFVQGCQTAVVVGPGGEEIYTDKYGRVKVQFHWDREGKKNENSSCWIRVSHPWAGQGWGSVSIPRIGQEVIVDFLEGDPDQPIIVGRVYNAEQMPPFGMPGGAMVSGMKSNSTKGGGGHNELSMNDTKGKELITIHGQYDMDTTVLHDQRTHVTNNQSEDIGVDKSSSVGANKTISVGGNHDETISGNKVISVSGTHTETIGSSMSESTGASKTETVAVAKLLAIGAAYQVAVGAAMNETIAGLKAEEIGGAKIVLVGGLSSENVAGSKKTLAGGGISENTPASIAEKAGAAISMAAGADLSASANGAMSLACKGAFSADGKAKGTVNMASELVLKCGGASITLSSGGDIVIKGTNISVKGSQITINASGEVGIKGSTVKEN